MDLNLVCQAMEKRGYEAKVFETKEEAADYLVDSIKNTTVGTGGSMTLDALDICDRLIENNERVYYRNRSRSSEDTRAAMFAPVYITSANAVTEDGVIVNIDGSGNRIAAASFDKECLYYVIGTNKIVPDLEAAIFRARNVAAPLNAKRLGRNTPCAVNADKCYDCSGPTRICKTTVITEGKMLSIDKVEVIIIKEDLGY